MIPQAAITYLKDALGCICAAAIRVVVMDGCNPVDWSAIGGGGPSGPGDLEVVCDAEGNQIFIKTVTDTSGNCTFINPITMDVLCPGQDFFPCPPSSNADIVALLEEIKSCLCEPCPEGFLEEFMNKWSQN